MVKKPKSIKAKEIKDWVSIPAKPSSRAHMKSLDNIILNNIQTEQSASNVAHSFNRNISYCFLTAQSVIYLKNMVIFLQYVKISWQ